MQSPSSKNHSRFLLFLGTMCSLSVATSLVICLQSVRAPDSKATTLSTPSETELGAPPSDATSSYTMTPPRHVTVTLSSVSAVAPSATATTTTAPVAAGQTDATSSNNQSGTTNVQTSDVPTVGTDTKASASDASLLADRLIHGAAGVLRTVVQTQF